MNIEASVYELTAPRQGGFKTQVLDSARLASHELLCKTRYSALSPGTELSAYMGARPLRPIAPFPRVNGYLNVAQVVARGEAATTYAVGDWVLSTASHRSAFTISESDVLLKVSDPKWASATTLTYLYQLSYDALLKCGFFPGMRVAVVGLGVIGLGAIELVEQMGGTSYGFSAHDSTRALAKTLGARGVYSKTDSAAMDALTGPDASNGLIDLVLVTSNHWGDWELALRLARKSGTIGVLGFPGRSEPVPSGFNPLDSQTFYTKQLRIISCGMVVDSTLPASDLRFTLKRNCAQLYEWICLGKLRPERLIAAERSAHELGAIYEEWSTSRATAKTVVLNWGQA